MGLKVGVLGVGPVGEKILQVLSERAFPADGPVTVMATSERDENLNGKPVHVRKISEDLFGNLDLVFFAGKEGAKGASLQWAEIAVKKGCTVIDNGGDLRMYPCYPLVIPEINMDAVTADMRLICNPNCSTIQMAISLYPLHKAARLRRVIVSTYQSVSGHSGAAIEQLKKETRQVLSGNLPEQNSSIFTRQIAFNCIPHIDRFTESGYTREELKMINETRKIFGEPNLMISATTVRVPVMVGHGESINAEFMEPMHAAKAIEILSDKQSAPGIVCMDGMNGNEEALNIRGDSLERNYPVGADLAKDEWRDAVLVGRIRDDMTAPNCINLWCVSDNLRKGAATNAVQIAEQMIKRGLL
ncbi:MAG TPA: aspartate-semialdehyde dehydrogenase [Oscillospiraceae bacterium]|nr:aspartate-semialdehyde dehydrogenase [Oscillospiraceae bacterium]HPF54898.1 aspartate-semialdehyde dehydrogenase [Clostridiales bacterium]HPK34957.1 aspartate-semialdehyde dehydrogenase [Oscillospiraceae bacterium]HPR75334.1 aspartate-semialdehyde dehydrogenase [Oscillospiraceae bacterium]